MKRRYIEEDLPVNKLRYGNMCVDFTSTYNNDITVNILDIEHIFILNSIDSPVICEKHNIMPKS